MHKLTHAQDQAPSHFATLSVISSDAELIWRGVFSQFSEPKSMCMSRRKDAAGNVWDDLIVSNRTSISRFKRSGSMDCHGRGGCVRHGHVEVLVSNVQLSGGLVCGVCEFVGRHRPQCGVEGSREPGGGAGRSPQAWPLSASAHTAALHDTCSMWPGRSLGCIVLPEFLNFVFITPGVRFSTCISKPSSPSHLRFLSFS